MVDDRMALVEPIEQGADNRFGARDAGGCCGAHDGFGNGGRNWCACWQPQSDAAHLPPRLPRAGLGHPGRPDRPGYP